VCLCDAHVQRLRMSNSDPRLNFEPSGTRPRYGDMTTTGSILGGVLGCAIVIGLIVYVMSNRSNMVVSRANPPATTGQASRSLVIPSSQQDTRAPPDATGQR